jgi:hypothetical protein
LSATLAIGGKGGALSSGARMYFYEMLVFNKALNATERGQINTYYATALNLTL